MKKKEFFIISVLGSSNGKANQTFNYSILPDDIWIRESLEEPIRRWHLVKDFIASDKNSEHYEIEQVSGKIRFGDGENGMIPPAGCTIVAVYQDVLRARNLVALRGVGKGYNGFYYVKSVTHTIRSGYKTTFNLVRKEDEKTENKKAIKEVRLLGERQRSIINEYFYGKLLTAADFKTEQQYFVNKKKEINRLIRECRRESCLMSILIQIMKCLSWKMEGTISISVIPNRKVIVEKESLQSLARESQMLRRTRLKITS